MRGQISPPPSFEERGGWGGQVAAVATANKDVGSCAPFPEEFIYFPLK